MATMNSSENTNTWGPVEAPERYTALDLLRGFALFGVLLINLLYFFRVSLFDHILRFHSHAGRANHVIDILAKVLLEFKAFDLFALTFGIGLAVQSERAAARGVQVEAFLLRRFIVLSGLGACHMLLVSNVDILTLGQYLRPSAKHLPIIRYVPVEEFTELKRLGCEMGFRHVESGPLVRSSYHAADALQ